MKDPDIARRRLHNQRLVGAPFEHPLGVVQWFGAVQSQDYGGAKWGIAQRTAGTVDAEIDAEFARGAIIRTHVLRPTWHLVLSADVRWMLALTAPRVHAANAHYYRKFELDDATFSRTDALLRQVLEGGAQLTRVEIAQVLNDAGISVSNLRLVYILMRAELDAVICSGALRGKQHTYALLDERVPPVKSLTRDEALAELTERFFHGHGPALLQDFVWWSGLSSADAKTGIELAKARLLNEIVGDKSYWFGQNMTAPTKFDPTVHLLPNYDEYLVAYKERSPTFDPAAFENAPSDRAFDGHIIVIDGQVVGGWRREIKNRSVTIEVKPLITLNDVQRAALMTSAERYGHFIGMPVSLAG